MEFPEYEKMNRYQIIMGMNDSETRTQKFPTGRIQKIVSNVCKGYRVAFSISDMHGGYFHDDGMFVSENSLCITLIGADNTMVDEIAKDVCAFFNQESVLVTRDTVDCRFVQEIL